MVTSGALVSGITGSGLNITISAGGDLTDAALTGGRVNVLSGGMTTGNSFNGVTTTLNGGASSLNDTWLTSGTGGTWSYAYSGATVTGATVGTSGFLQIQTGATATDLTATSGGSAVIAAGTTSGIHATDGGYVQSGALVFSGYAGNGEVVDTGAILTGTWSAKNENGQTVYTNGSVTVHDPVILNGATLVVMSGAVVSGLTCFKDSIPTISVLNGATLTDSHVTRTYVRVDGGGLLSNNQFLGCDTTLNTGAASIGDSFGWYGYAVQSVKVASGATVSDVTVLSSTTISAATGAVVDGANVASGGSAIIAKDVDLNGLNVSAGGYLATYTSIGGTITIPTTPGTPEGTVLNGSWSAVLSNGATIYTNGVSSYAEPVTLGNGAALYVQNGAVASGLSGYGVTIYVQAGGTLADSYIAQGNVTVSAGGVTSGNKFNSDPVNLLSGASSINDLWYNSGYDINWSTVNSGASVTNPQFGSGAYVSAFPGSVVEGPSVSDGAYLVVDKAATDTCFLAGTMILTDRGEIAVETLRVGDQVVCHVDGQDRLRAVIWVGQRQNRFEPWQPEDMAGYPVRIRAGAFGEGQPHSDLLVTAEHCFLFDGRFVPVRMLVNGESIAYDRSMPIYDYYHVELSQHSIIYANGVKTESYLDSGNRQGFRTREGVATLMPVPGAASWEKDAAAPLCVERGFVEGLYRRFAGQCADKGSDNVALTDDPALMLVDDRGTRYLPVRKGGDRVTFHVPPGISALRLVSRTMRPCDVIGPFVDDRRRLGVLVGEVTQFGAHGAHALLTHLTVPELAGWHDGSGACRWTDGAGLLLLNRAATASESMISVQIVSAGPYRMALEPDRSQPVAA